MSKAVFRIVAIVCAVAVQSGAQTPAFDSTGDAQSDVALTAYNTNLALVRERRTVQLRAGVSEVRFMDVAEQIRPETVSVRAVGDSAITILEQNYEYDLMSPDKLMEKYVGRDVQLRNFDTENSAESTTARLLSVNGGPIYKVGDDIFLGYPGSVVLPEIPGNLIAQPTLVWRLESDSASVDLEVTYLTRGVSWKADYVVTLADDESSFDIDAWVTLDNQSGATYTDAKLKLVAGDVNQVREPRRREMMVMAEKAAMAPAPMEQESFGEYHLYTLPRSTTIKMNQSKQVMMFQGTDVPAVKTYELRSEPWYYLQRAPELPRQSVAVYLEFRNDEEAGMGMPLPAGVMRVYQPDSEGMLQFSGEDRIDHTPKDEDVRLKLGDAFDIVGERRQTDYTVISQGVFESSYAVTLRNHKETAVTVKVVESMPGLDWEMLNSSIPYEKRDVRTAVFDADVAPDGETELTYRVRVRTR